MGMKKKSKDQGYFIVVNGGGAQHTRSGGGMDGIHKRSMQGEIRSSMVHFPCERQRGNKGEERGGSAR